MQTDAQPDVDASNAVPEAHSRRRETAQLFCVEMLRGGAALAVLAHHACGFFYRNKGAFFESHNAHPTWLDRLLVFPGLGYLGVPLFFVISGFCIHLPYANAERIPARSFAVRRFWRIYPPFFTVVLLVAGLLWVQHHSGAVGRMLAVNVLRNLFLLYPNVSDSWLSPVFWTISIEIQFYVLYFLAFPILYRIGFGRAAVWLTAADLAYRVGWACLDRPNSFLPLLSPEGFAPARFGEWLLGAYIAQAYARKALPSQGGALALAGSVVVLAAGSLGPLLPGGNRLITGIAAIGFALLLTGLISREAAHPLAAHGRLSGVGSWLAARSYSIYLVHFTIIASVGVLAARLLHITDRDALGGTPIWLTVTLIGVAAALVAADLLYHVVEKPSHQLGRRLSARRAEQR